MSGKKLAVAVNVAGVTYEAGEVPPPEVAEQISNPKAWGDQPDNDGEAKPARKSPARKSNS